ncbi:MAG: hypothetical protein ACI89X_000160 [Planctomycetota bacterium]
MLHKIRYSLATLRFEDWWKRRKRTRHANRQTDRQAGQCPICTASVSFIAISDSPREQLQCSGCGSVPRQRALAHLLTEMGIAGSDVHECSPSLCTFWFLQKRCRTFEASYFWPDRPAGAQLGAVRNVDLGKQTYANAAFDFVITQDVLEHVPNPVAAIREIHRSLRPGGAHVFTVPRMQWQATEARAELHGNNLRHLKPPEYHRDPIRESGSLVITDWGMDLEQRMSEAVDGVTCEARVIHDPALGIPHPIEVFVARNPS